jgi:class 3 adenylate cyclase
MLVAPEFIAFQASGLLEKIHAQLRAAYLCLERTFLRCGAELAEEVFKRLYDVLNTALQLEGRPDLVGRAWSFVAEPTLGYYFIDDVQLQKVVAHFKANQHQRFSPIELAAMFLTSPLPFQESLAIEAWRQNKVLDLPWSKAKYISDAPEIFEAELALYKSDCYTATTLAEVRDRFLVLAFPREVKEALLPIIELNAPEFRRRFAEGMKHWSPYIRRISKLHERALPGQRTLGRPNGLKGRFSETWFRQQSARLFPRPNESKEFIHFRSKVEAIDKSADRQRDFDMFVMSAKGETSTRSFQNWAGGEQVTLAIVFTDVVGSTALGEEIRDEAMNEVRRAHFAQSRNLIGQSQGREIKTIGDSFMAGFKSVDAALDYVRALQGNTGHPQVQIRAGIHIGPMHVEEGDVFGGTVNFAARVIGAIEQKAEIWLSDRAKEDIDRLGAGKHKHLKWERHEGVAMKGFPGKFTLWSLIK